MRKFKRAVSILLSVIMTVSLFTIVPIEAGAQADLRDTPSLTLKEGTYVPNQVVVLFKNGAVDTKTFPKKGDVESVGADFGDMMDASSSKSDALSAADDEIGILSGSLGDDFVLEDTLVFDEPKAECGKAGESVGASSDNPDGLTIALVSSEKYDTAELIKILSGNKNVAKVEPNYCVYPTELADYSLNDELSSYLYHVNSPAAKNNGGDSVDDRGADPETALSINAASGWEKVTDTDKEVVVAVIDSGVYDIHEDLKDVMWTNPGDIGLKGTHGYDFGKNKDKSGDDDVGHGTHCAGIIAAQANNAKGVAGIASGANVKIMALKTMAGIFSASTAYATFGAYNYIHKAVLGGVNVVAVNNSWGTEDQSDIFNSVIDLIGEDGVVSYFAAGNDATDCDALMFSPANTTSEYAITVGAADITGKPTAFSNYGKSSVDIFGAGMNILSTVSGKTYYPDIYSTQKLNETTEYYGVFNADTVPENGTVVPSKGAAGEDVKTFGELKFVSQPGDPSEDTERTGQAELELSLENGRHFNSKNPYRLKLTIKNAQPNEEYFIYFPYLKNPLTTGSDNTYYSFSGESIASPTGDEVKFYCGEVSQDEEGRYLLTGRQSYFVPGGSDFCITAGLNDGAMSHSTNIASKAVGGMGNKKTLLSAEEAEGKELGMGLYAFTESIETDSEHELSLYLDSIAVSKPGIELEDGTAYDIMSGTSMACPSVCGGGAMVAALNPRMEGESGAAYAKRIRAKVLSCVTQTEELKDLCSTGGYLDLSKLDAAVPSISDAVCDVDKETLTLKGANLLDGSTVTYKRINSDTAQETALDSGMTVDYSADGTEIVINNAKKLFSTYTQFFVTTPDGSKGTGSFFLVKGQKQLTPVSSEMMPDHEYYIRNDSDFSQIREQLIPPHLLADAEGKQLYGFDTTTGKVMSFDGEQFRAIKNSGLLESVRARLLESGFDHYSVYNDFEISAANFDIPVIKDGVVYVFVQISQIQDEDSGDEDPGYDDPGDDDPGDDDPDDDDPGDDDPGDDDPGEEDPGEWDDPGEEDPGYGEVIDDMWSLGVFDVNKPNPQWSFSEVYQIPSAFDLQANFSALNAAVCGGKIYMLGNSSFIDEETGNNREVYSLDLTTKKWTREPDLPTDANGLGLFVSNGRLYAMFGSNGDETTPDRDRIQKTVFCLDGDKWVQKSDIDFIGRATDISLKTYLHHYDAATQVKNGLLFIGASVDGGGNVFLYNTSTDTVEPLYYTTSDSLSDSYYKYSSCAATVDGVYYIRQIKDDYTQGWALSLLPSDSGAYMDPYATVILGDANGDGVVDIKDATEIQKYLAEFETVASFDLTAADVDRDGFVTIADVSAIQQYLADLNSPAGIGFERDEEDALSLWTTYAPLKSELVAYIKTITDESSSDFIPVENRIAVFDMDGTLCCETDPGYFDHKLLYHRVMEDPDYKDKASDYEKAVCADIKTYFDTGVYPKGMDVRHGTAVATAFKGMTPAEFDAYVKAYRDTPMDSYTGMTNGQAFYKPMLQVVDYLQANGFKVYIVSGTDRLITRGLAEGMIDIPLAQMIGSDESLVATGQGDTNGLDYTFTQDDELVTGGEFIIKNLKMNKVSVIEQEIGLQPVLCFGNSSGDAAMANYTITNNKYKSGAFLLCCDDLVRENGNLAKADSMRASCEKNGWTAVSMKNDWTTIYGDGVTKK